MKALIVDDASTTRFVIKRVLTQRYGCEVDEAVNGVAAMEALAREVYDLVLLDLVMPEMDGLATLQAIRQKPGLANLPVVVMTADRDEAMVRKVIVFGVADYLIKPFNANDIIERLERIVRGIERKAAGAQGVPNAPK